MTVCSWLTVSRFLLGIFQQLIHHTVSSFMYGRNMEFYRKGVYCFQIYLFKPSHVLTRTQIFCCSILFSFVYYLVSILEFQYFPWQQLISNRGIENCSGIYLTIKCCILQKSIILSVQNWQSQLFTYIKQPKVWFWKTSTFILWLFHFTLTKSLKLCCIIVFLEYAIFLCVFQLLVIKFNQFLKISVWYL